MKKTAQRLIDAPLSLPVSAFSGSGGSGGGGGSLPAVFATPVANALLLLDSVAQWPMSTFKAASAGFLVLAADPSLPGGRVLTAGAGLTATDGGAGGALTLNVVAGHDALLVNADNIVIQLATPSGLETTGGLQLADTLAGAGLTMTAKVLDVVSGNTGIVVNANNLVLTLAATSGLAISSGLMLADSVAGAGLTISSKVLAVGAGAGLTVNADDVALTTPGTLTVSTTNASAGSHTHAVTASSAPGAAAALLKTDAAGGIQLDTNLLYVDGTNNLVGIGTAPAAKLHVEAATEQLRLGYNATIYATHTIASNGVYTIGQTGGSSDNLVLAPDGNIILNPNSGAAIGDVLPNLNYRVNLGSPTKQWLSIHAAELWIQTLVAEDVISTIGGRIFITPTTELTRDIGSADTTVYVKHNQMQAGDIILLKRANLAGFGPGVPLAQVEFLQVDSTYTTVTAAPPESEFSYTVIRNLDGTGANDWYAGDALTNTGTTGSGFHEIYSQESILSVPFDAIYTERQDTGAFSNNHAPFKTWTPFAAGTITVGDAVYFGVIGSTFNSVFFYLSRAMDFTGAILLEYWDGVAGAWASLGDVTATFTSTGFKQIGFSAASATDWAVRSVNGVTAFWVRARISSISTFGSVYPLVSGRRAFHEKNQWGPTWVVWHRNSDTFNDFTERLAAGQLRGLYDYSASSYGFAAGRYAATYPWLALDDTNGLRIMRHNTQMAQWDVSGNILVGQVAAGQSNVYITAGAIKLRNNTTDVITLRATAAADGTIASFDGAIGISTSGGIYQGTGTFSSPTTGLKVWNDGGIGRIAGYNTGALQWYANTDGKLYAGAGSVVLDAATGITVYDAKKIRFQNTATGTRYVDVYGAADSTSDTYAVKTSSDSGGKTIRFWALKDTAAFISQAALVIEAVSGTDGGAPVASLVIVGGANSFSARVEQDAFIVENDTTGIENFRVLPANIQTAYVFYPGSAGTQQTTVGLFGTTSGIGIGTGTIANLLDVFGTFRASGASSFSSTMGVTGVATFSGGTVFNNLVDNDSTYYVRTGGTRVGKWDGTSGFFPGPDSTLAYYIKGGVNGIGINVSIPAYPLDVAGSGHFSGGLNLGTASAAGNGQLKTSSRISPGGTVSNGGQLFATHTTGVTGGAGATNLITQVGSEVTLYVINGISTTSGTRRFGDLVFAGLGLAADLTPFKSITAGTPATRTYSFSGSNLRVALTGSTDVYAVTVLALGSNEN